jgi:hypothetical protein
MDCTAEVSQTQRLLRKKRSRAIRARLLRHRASEWVVDRAYKVGAELSDGVSEACAQVVVPLRTLQKHATDYSERLLLKSVGLRGKSRRRTLLEGRGLALNRRNTGTTLEVQP